MPADGGVACQEFRRRANAPEQPGQPISARPPTRAGGARLPSGCRKLSHPPDTLRRTQTAADPDAAVIQRPPRPEPKLQGQGGQPGCAEANRAQRAPTRPQRPKTMDRRRRGRETRRSRGRGAENAKNSVCVLRPGSVHFIIFHPAAESCHSPLIPWGGTETAADPDAAVIQRPLRPEPKLQGQGGQPGCAEADRAQRAPTRPQRPKTMDRRRRGRETRRSRGGGRRTRKSGCCSGWVQFAARIGSVREDELMAEGDRGRCWSAGFLPGVSP